MRLEHTFTVPVPVEQAWRALLDPERVAPCFPGATLTGVDDAGFSGTVKVRLGPVALLYKGTGRFAATDEVARRLVLEAGGKDSRGNGTAQAKVTATLTPAAGNGPVGAGSARPDQSGTGPAAAGGCTRVDVVTELTITGKPAQLGRGLVGEVGGKILNAFAACLADRLAEPSRPAPPAATGPPSVAGDGAAPAGPRPLAVVRPPPVSAGPAGPGPADEIDLIQLAGRPVLRRLAPVAAVLLAVLLVRRWLHHRH